MPDSPTSSTPNRVVARRGHRRKSSVGLVELKQPSNVHIRKPIPVGHHEPTINIARRSLHPSSGHGAFPGIRDSHRPINVVDTGGVVLHPTARKIDREILRPAPKIQEVVANDVASVPAATTKSRTPKCSKFFMMCQMIGNPPISTMGFGRYSVSSRNLVPNPPASSTAFMYLPALLTVHEALQLTLRLVPLTIRGNDELSEANIPDRINSNRKGVSS